MIIKNNKNMGKMWLAVFFGYTGTNFTGLQIQKQEHVRTVEKELVTVLWKGGMLCSEFYPELVKSYKWGRAARTDKGVHAVMNGIACLFQVGQKFYDEDKVLDKKALLFYLRELFEQTEIIIHAIKRVTTRFDIRQMVKYRAYSYVCPWYYFHEEGKTEEETLEKMRKCCSKMVGAKNFHNFSKNLKAKDPQSRRYVMEFGCERVGDNVQFTIRGQSFVYHQIRKMIGLIIQVFLNGYDPEFIQNTFYNNQLYILLAPPFGLYLKRLSFDSYNKKPEVPQKIQFQNEEPNLQQYEQRILQEINKTDKEKWSQWFEQSKQGIIAKQEDEEEHNDY